ncbi:MAG TPA: hypothetical protein VKU92_01800 [Acidimicrobiales bacterium]|nr:hypothetical protein [Acidimicrobiales bacterium]
MALNKVREHMRSRSVRRAVERHARREHQPLLGPSELYPRQVHFPR